MNRGGRDSKSARAVCDKTTWGMATGIPTGPAQDTWSPGHTHHVTLGVPCSWWLVLVTECHTGRLSPPRWDSHVVSHDMRLPVLLASQLLREASEHPSPQPSGYQGTQSFQQSEENAQHVTRDIAAAEITNGVLY